MNDIFKWWWEIRPCWTGTICWCRRICTVKGKIIIDGNRLEKSVASYFVALHNQELANNQKYFKKFPYKKHSKIRFLDTNSSEDKYLPKDMIFKKWRIKDCLIKNCKCKLIETEDGEILIGSGNLNRQMALYFCKLHNKLLRFNPYKEKLI